MEGLGVRRELKFNKLASMIFNDKELIKKIMVTLGIVILYRVISLIPNPAIDFVSLKMFLSALIRRGGIGLFGSIVNMVSAGVLRECSILALGIVPFLSACIIIQIFNISLPSLMKYYNGHENNRDKIVKYTYFLTIALGIIQSFFIAMWLEEPANFGGYNVMKFSGWGHKLIVISTLSAGVLLLLWFSILIDKYGVGNGIATIAISAVIFKTPVVIYGIIMQYSKHMVEAIQTILLLFIFIASITIMWLITKRGKSIPIVYKDSNIQNSIVIRYSWPGRVPLMLTGLVLFFPPLSRTFTPMVKIGWLYTFIFSALTFFFTYCYMALLFRPKDIINKLRKYNCQIQDIGLGEETEEYLDKKATKVVIITALFLIALGTLPRLYGSFMKFPHSTFEFAGGASLAILVGVFYDLKCRIESYFAMKQYNNIDSWEVADITLDEIDAEIKKGFLETKGIHCVIEPSRYTWGLPIKTVVDQYRLYVPNTKLEEAKELVI